MLFLISKTQKVINWTISIQDFWRFIKLYEISHYVEISLCDSVSTTTCLIIYQINETNGSNSLQQ